MLALLIAVAASASSILGQTAVSRSLTDLGFIAGCWESAAGKKSQTTEQWMKPSGGMMLGMGRTIADGKAVDYEFMRFEQRGSDLIFISRPRSNKEDTEFKMITLTPTEAVFENPTHDFPQRVIYRLAKDGSLAPRIEGTVNGKTKAIDFPMVRVACDK